MKTGDQIHIRVEFPNPTPERTRPTDFDVAILTTTDLIFVDFWVYAAEFLVVPTTPSGYDIYWTADADKHFVLSL